MKSHFNFYCILILLFTSCTVSKEARNYKREINGNWQLKSIITEGITGKYQAAIFNEADFNCFIGSTWNFNARNSLGTYSIAKNADECVAINRNIRWSIYEAKDQPKLFQFKRLDKNLKEIDENSGGFRFTIVQIDNNTMQLRSDLTFEGKPANFIYKFVRL